MLENAHLTDSGSDNNLPLEIEPMRYLFGPQLHEHARPLCVDGNRRLEQLDREWEGLHVVVISEEEHEKV